MLNELKTIHADLRDAIAALEDETLRPAPKPEALAAARLRLSRTSRRRRCFIECSVYPLLLDLAPDDIRKIANLRQEAARMLIESSEHIGRWTARSIAADWAGYQRASAAMRSDMIRRIADEIAILYPLLRDRPAATASITTPSPNVRFLPPAA